MSTHPVADEAPVVALGVKLASKCNFCDSVIGLELHHIIPRSLGGTDDGFNLLTVCNVHHGLLHGMKRRSNIAELTKLGLEKAKQRGVKLGGPSIEKARAAAYVAVSSGADAFAETLRPTIERMLAQKMNITDIAREFNANGTSTARGGVWNATTVRNLIARLNR